jgi:hypothetical protein
MLSSLPNSLSFVLVCQAAAAIAKLLAKHTKKSDDCIDNFQSLTNLAS